MHQSKENLRQVLHEELGIHCILVNKPVTDNTIYYNETAVDKLKKHIVKIEN